MASNAPHVEPTVTVADGGSPRQAWIDNLRVAVITGVIGAHVALIYALDVGWYYEERTASTAARAILAAVFSPGLLFGMGLLFLVAGMCTPPALAAKGPRRFVAERLRRLGVPLLVYGFVVNPALNHLGDRAMDQGEPLGAYFRQTYRHDVEFGVAWFIAALLVFSVGYAAWRARRPARARAGTLSRRDVGRAVVFIAVASFVVRLQWPFLGTGELAGLNLWEYPQMVTMFVLGVLAAERGWLADGLPASLRHACGWAAAVSGFGVAVVAVGLTFVDDADPFLGGLHAAATIIPVLEGTIAVCASLWLVDALRRRWDRTTTLRQRAGRASFAAYLIHAPITILLAAALREVPVPAELKFVVVFGATVVLSFALGGFVSRARPAGRIL